MIGGIVTPRSFTARASAFRRRQSIRPSRAGRRCRRRRGDNNRRGGQFHPPGRRFALGDRRGDRSVRRRRWFKVGTRNFYQSQLLSQSIQKTGQFTLKPPLLTSNQIKCPAQNHPRAKQHGEPADESPEEHNLRRQQQPQGGLRLQRPARPQATADQLPPA